MAIENWMPTLETKVGEITGLDGGARSPYQSSNDSTGLPHSLGELPVAIILPTAMQVEYSVAGPFIEVTDVQITIYVVTGILAEAMNSVIPFVQRMRDKLAANISLSSTVNHILPVAAPAKWMEGPGGVEYARKIYTGVIFHYQVKENVSGDFTVSA